MDPQDHPINIIPAVIDVDMTSTYTELLETYTLVTLEMIEA